MSIKQISIKTISILLLYLILFFLLFIPFWFKKKFGIVYVDQLFFHLELLFQGSLVGDAQVQKSFYKWSIITSVLSTSLYLFLKNKYLKKKNFSRLKEIVIFIFFIFISVGFNTGFFKNINLNNKDFIANNYIFNEPISITNNERNLIVIYVESLDFYFSNSRKFEKDLLTPLSEKSLGGVSIKNFYQIPGYSFTINSLLSTQCGIPAKPLGFFKGSDLKNIKNFLPNIKCLSDYTKELNYRNIFITSDEIENFGVKYFLENHNYSIENIYDLKKLYYDGYETSQNAWRGKKNKYGGMHDDILFEASFDIIKKIKNENMPYFISIFTLDTHSPRGYPSHKCLKSQFKDPNILKNYSIKHSVICSVDSLSKFILKLKILDRNTDIVIMGDHSYPDNYEKKTSIYNKFILDKDKNFNREKMNHLDFFPSFLSLLGFKLQDNRMGLGFNIFNDININTYDEFTFDLEQKLAGKSEKYLSFWEND